LKIPTIRFPIANFIAGYDSLRFGTRVILAPIVYLVKYPLLLLHFGAALALIFIRKKE